MQGEEKRFDFMSKINTFLAFQFMHNKLHKTNSKTKKYFNSCKSGVKSTKIYFPGLISSSFLCQNCFYTFYASNPFFNVQKFFLCIFQKNFTLKIILSCKSLKLRIFLIRGFTFSLFTFSSGKFITTEKLLTHHFV